jgi:hypothetical protein
MAARLTRYLAFYNHERLYQSLAYRTPAEVDRGTWHSQLRWRW